MKKVFPVGVFFLIALISFNAQSIVRFEQDQLHFVLVDSSTGAETTCKHYPLETGSPAPPPPWWTVNCGDRSYTVDIWMDNYRSADQFYNTFLLFHAKESVSSSGKKLVQFNNQTTTIKTANPQALRALRSSIDVGNGLTDLNVEVRL